MTTNHSFTPYRTTHNPAGHGPHHLMLGTVAVSRLLSSEQSGGQLSLVELIGAPGSGPGPHIDSWRETFYVLEGELTFRVDENEGVRTIVARTGDVVSIPIGVGHAFSVTGRTPARYLMGGTAAGIDAFFADAGEPIASATLPSPPPPFDRERLRAAFAKYNLAPHSFPAEGAAVGASRQGSCEP
ncbi:MAG: cupin domain-containing protein [Vicinamibacterales bacterium]